MPTHQPTHPTHSKNGAIKPNLRVPSKAYIFLLMFLLGLAGWLVGFNLELIDRDIALSAQREVTLRDTSNLASRIEAETNSTFYLVAGLVRLIEMNGDITETQYREICSKLMDSKDGLVNIAAAPDMVIRYIYPQEGNEAAMGLDYRTLPHQKEAAFRVIHTGKPVIAGPLQLVQGGEAAIGRFPVYVEDPSTGAPTFWGIVSTPFRTSELYQESGLLDPDLGMEVTLRGRDSLGASGEVFYGSEAIYEKDPIRFPIELISGSWEMATIPEGGWIEASPNAFYIRCIIIMVTLLIWLVLWLFYLYLQRTQRSREIEAEIMETKERFYANMSHELRTPLNGICGLAELIGMSHDDPETKEHVAILLRSAETLTRLLDDVLLLSRSDNQASNEQDITVESLLAELLPPLLHEAEEKNLSFVQEPIPEACQQIRSNPAIIRQILWNLLSNAIKFTKAGRVTLRVKKTARGAIAFIISDTGIGIAEDRLDHIFDDFVQEDNGYSRRYDGAGLGLAVVHRLVKRLDGHVSVTSTKGVGSVFTVELPRGSMD